MYNDYVNRLEQKMNDFIFEAKGATLNKVSGSRARKLCQFLRRELKHFRTLSMKNQRGQTITEEDAKFVGTKEVVAAPAAPAVQNVAPVAAAASVAADTAAPTAS